MKTPCTNQEWTRILVAHLPEEFGSKDLSRAIIAADSVQGLKRTESGFQAKKTNIIGILKSAGSVVFSKDNAKTWGCLIMDRIQLEYDLEPRTPGRKKAGCGAVVKIAPVTERKPKTPIASKEEGAFLIAFKIYRSAVRRNWKKGVAYIPFEEIRMLSMMDDADDFPNKEEIVEAINIVKSCGVDLIGDPDFSGVTVVIPEPAIGLFHICIKGEEMFPHRKRFKDFKGACDASYESAKESVLSWTKKLEEEEQTKKKEIVPAEAEEAEPEKDETPEFIKLFTKNTGGDRQVIAKIISMDKAMIANEVEKSNVVQLSSDDNIYLINVGEGWQAELEMIKFLLTTIGDKDEIYTNTYLSSLYDKADAIKQYMMKVLTTEFEKRGL